MAQTYSATLPLKRFFRLLSVEKKEVYYVYLYAIFNGLLNLSIPLGIQAIITQIMGAQLSTSWVLLVSLVTAGVLITGILQLVQQSLVERMQQRIFTRAAFEFTYRLTHLPHQTLQEHYPPSLANRFFDVLNIQKGLPKLLIDFSAAILQLIFGLLLLSFYHSFFVFFSVGLFLVLIFILLATWNKALYTSLNESKYKYKVAEWLEEVVRSVLAVKQANTDFALQKTDEFSYNYITYRKKHFSILKLQFLNFTLFKTLIAGGLLVLGSVLVLQQSLNLGQFVASELIILLVIAASEKLVTSIEVLFDVLTAVEKMGSITDLELEKTSGIPFESIDNQGGIEVSLQNMSFHYKNSTYKPIEGFSLQVSSNSRLCISGISNAGKTALLKIIASIYTGTTGIITYNGLPRDNYKLNTLRAKMGFVFKDDILFQGSLLDNITLKRKDISIKQVQEVIDRLFLTQFVQTLPQGLSTEIRPEGQGLPNSVIRKVLLARAIIHQPKLLLIDASFHEIESDDLLAIFEYLQLPTHPWTLIIVSNQAAIASKCSEIVVIKNGKVTQKGNWTEIVSTEGNAPIFF